jgi:hypothetical protein
MTCACVCERENAFVLEGKKRFPVGVKAKGSSAVLPP